MNEVKSKAAVVVEPIRPAKPPVAESTLDENYRKVVEKVEGAMAYYASRKKTKRLGAQLLRICVIVLFSVAGLVPLVDAAGLFGDAPGKPDSGQIGILLAAIGGAMLGLDRFFGFSSSWTRFTMAELNLQRMRDRFQIDWAIANTAIEADDPELERPIERLQLLKDFSMEVSKITEEETKVWISEYQSALAALEKSAKEKDGEARPGSIQVQIKRGEDVKGPVSVYMDGQYNSEASGNSAVIRRVPEGSREIQITGKTKSGQEVKGSQMVTVPSGGVASANVKLA